ncbi:hypothetical protein [Micromonospora sp. SH-82]|uniref:hypothetical protein n=1 Tax=Micromonospora sp. SH-82 TaxID=3132938 RepID=UPI003EBBC3D0
MRIGQNKSEGAAFASNETASEDSVTHRSSNRIISKGLAQGMALLGLGGGLGLLSFFSEIASPPMRDLLASTISAGSAWALTAFVVSILFAKWMRCVSSAIASLVVATVTYYFLIVASGTRSGGYALPREGEPAARLGLLAQLESMATGILLWIGLSIVAGLAVGSLGYVVGSKKEKFAAVAAGLTVGILAGPAVYPLTPLAFYGVAAQGATSIAGGLIILLASFIVPTLALAAKRRNPRWTYFAASICLAFAAALGVWHLVEQVRITL